MNERIGFIGQGWVGKHYADDFENREFEVVRYSLDPQYAHNKEALSTCSVVFIAVPTPTTSTGCDTQIVEEALTLLKQHTIVVIKSTIAVGTTEKLQLMFPLLVVLHSPEFLVEKTASYDAAHPKRNIIGIPNNTKKYEAAATRVFRILPQAPYNAILPAKDAELVKYAGNCFLYTKVLYMNLLYDLAEQFGCDFSKVREALIHDPRIGESHTMPVHASGRGAGGHCFIKDFEALRQMYDGTASPIGQHVLDALVAYNALLLQKSGKDTDLLHSVYGTSINLK